MEEPNIKIRELSKELMELEFTEEQAKKILEWVDTIPVRIYNSDVKVEVKKGTVRVNEHLIDPDDLSFNNLPRDLAIYYQWDNGYFYNPFNIPPEAILYNPFTGEGITAGDGLPAKMGNSIKTMRNPFNGKIITKIEWRDDKPYKKWTVDENNEWVEAKFD